MNRWVGTFILIILGWMVILTTQTTDLYNKNTKLMEENEQLKIMVKEYKWEIENQFETHKKDTEHTLLVHEQMCEAIMNGSTTW